MWIRLGIFCVCMILLMHWLHPSEGFITNNQCPAGFTFFTDLKGASFCCKGTVKDKQCMATDKNTFCGLAPNLQDPRTNLPLPTCSIMLDAIAASTSGKYCTKEMPNYIAPGTGPISYIKGGCSVAPARGDGSVFPFSFDGKNVATPYCLISGKNNLFELADDSRTTGRFNCEILKLKESIKCPKGLYAVQDPVQQGGITFCKSSSPYDQKTGNPNFCFPDEVYALFPNQMKRGELIGIDLAKTLCGSCSDYKKRWVDKDTTAKCVR